MKITFSIPVDDLEIIESRIDYFKGLLPRFELLSASFVVSGDESTAEYSEGASLFDWKEVTIEIDNYNNFWALAKLVQQIKIESL